LAARRGLRLKVAYSGCSHKLRARQKEVSSSLVVFASVFMFVAEDPVKLSNGETIVMVGSMIMGVVDIKRQAC
jgi:hypothetical protein